MASTQTHCEAMNQEGNDSANTEHVVQSQIVIAGQPGTWMGLDPHFQGGIISGAWNSLVSYYVGDHVRSMRDRVVSPTYRHVVSLFLNKAREQ